LKSGKILKEVIVVEWASTAVPESWGDIRVNGISADTNGSSRHRPQYETPQQEEVPEQAEEEAEFAVDMDDLMRFSSDSAGPMLEDAADAVIIKLTPLYVRLLSMDFSMQWATLVGGAPRVAIRRSVRFDTRARRRLKTLARNVPLSLCEALANRVITE
jgi:hypothetical protein